MSSVAEMQDKGVSGLALHGSLGHKSSGLMEEPWQTTRHGSLSLFTPVSPDNMDVWVRAPDGVNLSSFGK